MYFWKTENASLLDSHVFTKKKNNCLFFMNHLSKFFVFYFAVRVKWVSRRTFTSQHEGAEEGEERRREKGGGGEEEGGGAEEGRVREEG